MIKLISHRGNLTGINPDCENNLTYIQQAIDAGFDVEIDIWFLNGNFYLGHDKPTYLVGYFWLKQRSSKLWCHAKNLDAILQMSKTKNLHYFWHENDKMTLTSKGIPWLYPKNYLNTGITVEFDFPPKTIPDVYGLCVDNPTEWKNIL